MIDVQPAEPLQFVINEVESASRRRGLISLRGMGAARERKDDFANRLEMLLTGLAIDEDTRRYADELLDEHWDAQRRTVLRRVRGTDQRTAREVIIGSGYHAAVYASMRVACGFPKPLVVDQAEHVGGVFAVTKRPIFFLNSTNRPGGPGFVSDLDAQPNYLPGAPVQPANVSSAEFQTNADMAWVIRMALAQNANVLPGFEVRGYRGTGVFGSLPYYLEGVSGDRILAARVIDSRGLGEPRDQGSANGTTVLTFPQFMKRMDTVWPLRNIRRIAVIGDGDAARVAVEQALGIGPNANLSMAVDRVDLIDWYGPTLPTTPGAWRDLEKTRYLAISKFLRDGEIGSRKIRVFNRKSRAVALPDRALVDGRTYDLAVVATGWRTDVGPSGLLDTEDLRRFEVQGLVVSRAYENRLFRIGPHAALGFDAREEVDQLNKPTNRISMSRLGPKTAMLAAVLPEPDVVGRSGERLAA